MADMGYLVELSSIQLDEDTRTSWIHAFPYGKYEHPVYGEVEMNPTKARQIKENFDRGVRGQDLDIDYDHKAKDGSAAGWVKKCDVRADGIWLNVEWTKRAHDHIKNKEYRYFSPEFTDEWKHPQSGEVIKNVLFGGGITNRPFLKGILPLNMSELGMPSERPQEGNGMDPKKIRELLGLPEDATDEQVETALTERSSKEPEGDEGGEQHKTPESTDEKTPEVIAAGEGLPPEVIQLAESNPAVKALADHVAALGTELATTQQALRLTEVQQTVKELSEGKNALPAVAINELSKTLSELPVDQANAVVGILKKVQKDGLVQLTEDGAAGQAGTGGDGKDPIKAFSDEVAKVMASDKLSYADAAERVAALQPQLYAEHAEASYGFREN